jgi:hypothetical protein
LRLKWSITGSSVAPVAPARRAPADNGCSNATLRGSYGVHATGTLTAGPSAGPLAVVAVITFDGNGQLTLLQTQRLLVAGVPTTLKVPFTGTYSVNADCTFSTEMTNTLNGTISTTEAVIVDHAREYFALNTTAGAPNVVSAVARKQFPGSDDR